MLKCIFVKEIQHFRSPIPQNFRPAAGISLAFKGEVYLYPHLCYYFQKTIHTTKVFKNRNGEFSEKLPEMFRIFWLRWQLQYSKTTRKKHPSQKIETMNFLKTIRNVLDFLAPIVAAVFQNHQKKRGEIITKISVPDRKPPEKKATRVKKESKR